MNRGTVIDVRTPEEFASGHAAGSINIPLQQLLHRVSEIALLPQPLYLCCASGVRSAKATLALKAQGLECVNAGTWTNVTPSPEKTPAL